MKRALMILLAVSLTAAAADPSPRPARTHLIGAELDAFITEWINFYTQLQSRKGMDLQLTKGRAVRAIRNRIEALDPKEFNEAYRDIIDRYIAKPEERAALNELFRYTKIADANHYAKTADLELGWGHAFSDGVQLGTWFVLAGAGWTISKVLAKIPDPRFRLLQALQNLDRASTTWQRHRRWAYTSAKMGVAGAAAGAVAGGLMTLKWGYEVSQTRKLDPTELLRLAQVNIACSLSYRGLDIDERVEKADRDPETLLPDYAKLRKEIIAVGDEATELYSHYERLFYLRAGDLDFEDISARFDKLPDYQALRARLARGSDSNSKFCAGVSMDHVKRSAANALGKLDYHYSNLDNAPKIPEMEEAPAAADPHEAAP